MMSMQLSEAARVMNAHHIGPDAAFAGVSTDSRTLSPDNLFVALVGPHFDGHEYLEQAQKAGAVGATVSREMKSQLPLLKVDDTRQVLGQLAQHWRQNFRIPLIGVTGSNGKTTVKEMIVSILSKQGAVLATQGNLNNEIGVPQTLFGLGSEHSAAVIEMGANHPSEIAYLTSLAQPNVGVVTNAGPAHLEGFGDMAGVAKAKGELFSGLGLDGIAVINADDKYAGLWRELAGECRVIDFALQSEAAIKGRIVAAGQLEIDTPQGTLNVQLALLGRHNCLNALAATAATLAVGAGLGQIKQGLESLQPVKGRLCLQQRADGVAIIDDTYNANPASLQAAINVLADMPGESWLVLGDMAELGRDASEMHAEAGRQARSAGIKHVYSLGELAANANRTFGDRGYAFNDLDEMVSRLKKAIHPGVTLLIKGSRSMGMERVVNALLDTKPQVSGG